MHEYYGCTVRENSYNVQEKLGEGTFGEVYKAERKITHQVVALKKIFYHNDKEGFPLTALREIAILKDLSHENVIQLVDMSIEPGDAVKKTRGLVYMVTPYMDHDLCGLLQNPNVKLDLAQIKCYMKQLLEGMNYMHQRKYLHRDIKTANILIDNMGIVKIADFGLARTYNGPLPTAKGAGDGTHKYTQMVVTRWYRPIELIIGMENYTTAIDMWGIGCVFGEMFLHRPILRGASDIDQGNLIVKLLGAPNASTMEYFEKLPGTANVQWTGHRRQLETTFKMMDPPSQQLLSGLLDLNPTTRLTALGALSHKFFATDPQPTRPQDMPKFPTSHEMSSKQHGANVPHAPNVDNFEHKHANNDRPGRFDSYPSHQPPYRSHNNYPRERDRHQHHQHHHRNNRGHYRGGRDRGGRRGGGGGGGGGHRPPYRNNNRDHNGQPPYKQPKTDGPPTSLPSRPRVADHYDDDTTRR